MLGLCVCVCRGACLRQVWWVGRCVCAVSAKKRPRARGRRDEGSEVRGADGRRMTRRAAARNSWRSPRPGATAFVAPPPPPAPNNPDVARYAALVIRANETLRTKPFCALADLQRVLIAGEALSGLDAAQSARATMDMLIPQLRSVFERFLPDEAKKQPERAIAAGPTPKANEWTPAEKGTGVGRMCITRLSGLCSFAVDRRLAGTALRTIAIVPMVMRRTTRPAAAADSGAAAAESSNGIVAAPSPSPPSDLGPRRRPTDSGRTRFLWCRSRVRRCTRASRRPHPPRQPAARARELDR